MSNNRPMVTSETQGRQQEVHDLLANDIDGALDHYFKSLNDIAKKHGRNPARVHALAGIAKNKKANKGGTTAFAAFCGKKLKEENDGKCKAKGSMTTLPKFLKTQSADLHAKFKQLSDEEKEMFLTDHLQDKENKENVPKRLSNTAISKEVDSKFTLITGICQDLNRMYKTESLVLFCRGDVAHSYPSGSYATEGAHQWLEHAEVGHSTPHQAVMQMEGFSVSGLKGRVKKHNRGPAKQAHNQIRSDCRKIIQDGLTSILRAKNPSFHAIPMNYSSYEDKIVERLGVVLIGWPVNGSVCNPGTLSHTDAIILKDALESKECRWIERTLQEQEDQTPGNSERAQAANGEQVYGPLPEQ